MLVEPDVAAGMSAAGVLLDTPLTPFAMLCGCSPLELLATDGGTNSVASVSDLTPLSALLVLVVSFCSFACEFVALLSPAFVKLLRVLVLDALRAMDFCPGDLEDLVIAGTLNFFADRLLTAEASLLIAACDSSVERLPPAGEEEMFFEEVTLPSPLWPLTRLAV